MLKCDNCGYVGYAVCQNCKKTSMSCTCGKWKPQCPKCKTAAPATDE